jgi:hypothetical protein
MFIAYFDYMSSIVGLALCLSLCLYRAHPIMLGVSGKCCVGMVLRKYLSVDVPNVLSHVVDREGHLYSFVESSVVHSLNIGQVEPTCKVKSYSISDPPWQLPLMYEYMLTPTMIIRYNCTSLGSSMTYD